LRAGGSNCNTAPPLSTFYSYQYPVDTLLIQRITVLNGKSIIIDWGDEDYDTIIGERTNITKVYSVEGNYKIVFSGDLDYIQYFEWMSAGSALTGDLTGVRLWRNLEWFHFFFNNCYGDISVMLANLPSKLEIFHVGKSASYGFYSFTGSLNNIRWPNTISDIHLESNLFTGNPMTWVLPSPFVGDEGHIQLADNNISGSGISWYIPDGVHFVYFSNSDLIVDIGEWVIPSTLSRVVCRNTKFYGDISDWVMPITVRDAEGFEYRFDGTSVTGDCSSWVLPDDGGTVGASNEFNIISFDSCNVSKLPRGNYRHFKTANFKGNNCSSGEVDSFLLYLDTYFASNAPLSNCVYTLSGQGMSSPSSAGLTNRTGIINKYISAGKMAVINYYVGISNPSSLTISIPVTNGYEGIRLTWTDNSSGYAMYDILESVNGGEYKVINRTAAGATTYTRTFAGQTWKTNWVSLTYKIRGVDAMGNYSDYVTKTLTLGDELVNQSLWTTPSYWNKYYSANWNANGTAILSNGSNGELGRNNFWTTGDMYRVNVNITRVSGSLFPPYSTGNFGGQIGSVISYNMTGGASLYLGLYSSSFNGSINSMSIKKIIVE
jgi:hypothetical protein